MSKKIKSAFAGDAHVPFPAPQWDYANGQAVAIGASSTQSTAVSAQLVLLVPSVDCYISIGTNPTATAGAGSRLAAANVPFGETITPGDKVAVLRTTANGTLYILPAVEEAA